MDKEESLAEHIDKLFKQRLDENFLELKAAIAILLPYLDALRYSEEHVDRIIAILMESRTGKTNDE